jgi:hypothetical protein
MQDADCLTPHRLARSASSVDRARRVDQRRHDHNRRAMTWRGAVTTQRDERKKSAPRRIQAAASASRQVFIAAARNARCVRADVRWR